MSKARNLGNIVSTGEPLADGVIDTTDINGVTATATEINYLDGVTSNIQTQIDNSGGASTTYGDVGTYVWGRRAFSGAAQAQFVAGSTYAGSTLYPAGFATPNFRTLGDNYAYTSGDNIGTGDPASSALSGTWRAMGTTPDPSLAGIDSGPVTLFVRIS